MLESKRREAKEIIVNQMKRLYEEHQIKVIISDNSTIRRERDALIEKLKSLKIMEYLSN